MWSINTRTNLYKACCGTNQISTKLCASFQDHRIWQLSHIAPNLPPLYWLLEMLVFKAVHELGFTYPYRDLVHQVRSFQHFLLKVPSFQKICLALTAPQASLE